MGRVRAYPWGSLGAVRVGSCSHAKRRRVHVALFHHLPYLLVQLAVASHALHHPTGPVPLADEFTHVLLLDHHIGDPSICHGEEEEEPNDRTGAEVEELNAKSKRQEDAGRKDVGRPFETHVATP